MNSKFFKLFLIVFLIQIFITNNLKAQELLYDNGPFTTNTGVGFGGSDVSVMQNVTLGYSTLGYSVNNAGNFRLTDQFTNSAPWYLDYVDVFAYQTGSSVSSTFTSGVVKIWNSDPSSGTAISEFGDFNTNRMILTDFTNCYRVQENASLLDNNRPIMRIRISIGAIIQPGTHWIEWGLTGSLASGPFAPQISILGTGNTGDAKQFNNTGYTGTLTNGVYQVGIPFKIFGSQFVSYSPGPNPICTGSNVTVNFSDPVVRNIANSYTLELSDVNGNFPGTFLTTTVVSASQLSAVIPISTVGGANYKIRTVASSPSENSSPSDFLNVYSAPNAVVASQTDVSCNGGSNGSASVTASGGAGGYTYSWSPSGGTAATATGLSAGIYTVTVTDANGCTATRDFTITQPTALVATAASQTNISCNGGSNGAASINTPTGGAGGYTYNWTPGNPTGDGTTSVTGLTPGTWTCTVTDANNCTTTVDFIITQPTALVATAASQTNVSCNGGSNGAASINTPTGGAGGYTYNWTPGNPTGDGTTSVTGLTPGTWTCTVTDANNCTTAVNFTIIQPTTLVATAASQTNVSCNGGSNGAASINTPTGGAGGYTYNWTPGNPTGDGTTSVTGLTHGTWTCTVTDANNCTTAVNFTITQPTALVATAASQTNISCNGGSNGAASINTPTGGAGGYTYNWTPGNPTGDGTTSVTGLTPGTWTCTVTDANNCTTAVNFTITQPTALVATVASQTNVSCNGGSNGAASINTPTGGAGGYTYNWTPGNPTGDGTTSVTGLTPGTWTCTVTDANNCTTTVDFIITQPTAINFTTTVLSGYDYNTGYSQTIVASGGTGSKTYAVTAG
ncbi:beta strand repeat-containing protein, partial [Flavobacterium salmonis]|uniref:beta strand repeat-containing protein n=3 Tax=Flavobacterium salmonis TaxID=2654844 RepID=UPI003620DE3D